MNDQIDPSTVPPFPIYTIAVTDDDTAIVNGAIVDALPDETPYQAGVRALGEQLVDENLSAVRVRATSAAGTHQLIVTAAGESHDATPEEAPERKPVGQRKKLAIIAVAGALLLALVAGTGVLIGTLVASRQAPEPVATATTNPGAGAQLPVAAPAGFGSDAAWSIEVSPRGGAKILTDGSVLTLDTDRSLRQVDARTGNTTWIGRSGPSNITETVETAIDGKPVLAYSTGSRLQTWGLDDTPATMETIELGASSDVSYAGGSPLVELGDQTIAAISFDGVSRQELPAGLSPVTSDGQTVTSIGDGEISRTDGSRTPLVLPEAITGAPTVARGITPTYAIAGWTQGEAFTLALIDLDAGETVATTSGTGQMPRLPATPAHSDPAAQTAIYDRVFVRHDAAPSLALLPRSPTGLVGSETYVTGSAGSLEITRIDASGQATTEATTASPPPLATNSSYGYVIAERVDVARLYALPHIDDSNGEEAR